MKRVRLVGEGWASEANRAITFLERLRGIRSRSAGSNLLIETKSVHTLGLGHPLGIVVIDRDSRVIATRSLAPNRVFYHRLARFILEVPVGTDAPPLESVIDVIDV